MNRILVSKYFRLTNYIKRTRRPVYELEDLNKTPIDGQFYQD